MANWNLGELARAAGAELRHEGELQKSIAAVGTDTRSLPSASLFVALRGERFDGHDFLAAALDAGACAVVVDRAGDDPSLVASGVAVPRLVVDDTLVALGDIARYVRRLHGKPVVAVTGSNGKTTTKELCAAAMSAAGVVHKTAGNLNNLIGVPLTLFDWSDDAWAGVVEMGMNVPGEIARLTEIAEPNVALITNVAGAHLEGLGTLDNVGAAKGELFSGLESSATAVVNADDAVINRVAEPLLRGQRVIRFGFDKTADVRVLADSVRQAQGGGTALRAELSVFGKAAPLALPLVGAHNAINAAGAVAAGLALGLELDALLESIKNVAVPGGRLRVVTTPAGVNVIDDTYNANPDSMRAAFATLVQLANGARCIAVLGDMFELGEHAAELHAETGAAATAAGVGAVLALGTLGASVAQGSGGLSFRGLPELLSALDEHVAAGDWVLVKGSRGMKMERVVHHLQASAQGRA